MLGRVPASFTGPLTRRRAAFFKIQVDAKPAKRVYRVAPDDSKAPKSVPLGKRQCRNANPVSSDQRTARAADDSNSSDDDVSSVSDVQLQSVLAADAAAEASSSSHPAAAVASSSGTSSAYDPATQRYCFFAKEYKSFNGVELCRIEESMRTGGSFSHIINTWDPNLPLNIIAGLRPDTVVASLLAPGGVPSYIRQDVFEDVSRGAGCTRCPIAHDDYCAPHILNITGVTYSLSAITRAIRQTLMVGRPLVLGQRTIAPHELSTLRLYPNMSIVGHDSMTKRFPAPPANTTPRIDIALATANDVPEVSVRLQTLRYSYLTTVGWDAFIDTVYSDVYSKHRPTQPQKAPAELLSFCNLIIEDVEFPRGWSSYKRAIHWNNVLFRYCVFIFSSDETLEMSFSSCRFERCTFYFSGSASSINVVRVGATLAGCEITNGSHIICDENYLSYTVKKLQQHILAANGAIKDSVFGLTPANARQTLLFSKSMDRDRTAADTKMELLSLIKRSHIIQKSEDILCLPQ